jgi:hypothetical protein|tara:strand:+ start:209 stop:328 length:120 start_codon:yes stop_codon:yes gene_type:complete
MLFEAYAAHAEPEQAVGLRRYLVSNHRSQSSLLESWGGD